MYDAEIAAGVEPRWGIPEAAWKSLDEGSGVERAILGVLAGELTPDQAEAAFGLDDAEAKFARAAAEQAKANNGRRTQVARVALRPRPGLADEMSDI